MFWCVRLAAITTVLLSLWASPADARSPREASHGVPAVVARVLPAVVSITTRQVGRDQFDELVVTTGLGSGLIVNRRAYIVTPSLEEYR